MSTTTEISATPSWPRRCGASWRAGLARPACARRDGAWDPRWTVGSDTVPVIDGVAPVDLDRDGGAALAVSLGSGGDAIASGAGALVLLGDLAAATGPRERAAPSPARAKAALRGGGGGGSPAPATDGPRATAPPHRPPGSG